MKRLLPLFIAVVSYSCNSNEPSGAATTDPAKEKTAIAAMLDSVNTAAANADYDGYFRFYTSDAVFIGTDATEHWNKEQFMVWAKPYFDKKTTWNFKSLERHIYFGTHENIAWFDETLNTQMKICRGSGVVVKENGAWKLQQYVLSMTFPNDKIDDVLKLKAPVEDSLIHVMEKVKR